MTYLLHLLSNDNLTLFENFVIWINFFGACFAFYFNRKAFKSGIPRFRRESFLIAGLAFIYCVSSLILLLLDPTFLVWSSAMRGVSIMVWPIVWALPAVTSVRLWTELEAKVLEEVDE